MRNGADDKKLTEIFVEAVKKREPYYKETPKDWLTVFLCILNPKALELVIPFRKSQHTPMAG